MAALHYLRSHFEEATEIYKKLLIENKDYIGNVVGTFVCSKFDAEKMKDFLYENWCMKLPRARAKLVNVFGRSYFV